MEKNNKMLEPLIEQAAEYGKTSLRLFKLKALDKTTEIVSSFLPLLIVLGFILSGMLFLNIGLAIWFGEILGNSCFGFFVVAAFYGIIGMFMQLFLRKWLKKLVSNNIINQVLR